MSEPEPLSTVCEHCDATLKLKNPDLEGKKIKCPKCGEAFVVVAAGAKKAAAGKKTVKKKSDDDDMAFLDVDPDDYGPLSDEDEDDDDDEPKERRVRSSRGKKKKPRKKSSGNSGQLVKMLAIFLAVALALGGGVYGVMILAQGDGSSELDWLPSDVQGFIKVRVSSIWNAAAVQPFKTGGATNTFVQEMIKNIGVGPQDIDHLVVGVPSGSQSAQVFVIRASKPFDQAAMRSANPGIIDVTHETATYMKMNNSTGFYLPDPKTLVVGPEASIQAVITRGRKNPSIERFTFGRNYRDHVVMAMLNPGTTTSSAMANPMMMAGSGMNGADSILARANETSDIRMTMLANFKTPEAAKSVVEKAQGDLKKQKEAFAAGKTLMQNMPNPNQAQAMKALNSAEEVMNSIQVSQAGSSMSTQMTISNQAISGFAEIMNSLPSTGRTSPSGPPSNPFLPFLPFGN